MARCYDRRCVKVEDSAAIVAEILKNTHFSFRGSMEWGDALYLVFEREYDDDLPTPAAA